MQGVWKEKLCEYNHKGEKRKKQKRKHILKDKGKALLKTYYFFKKKKQFDSSFYIETEMKKVPNENIYKKSGFVETWIIEVHKYMNMSLSINKRTAYNFFGKWCDEYTNEPINNQLEGFIKPISFLYKEEIEYESPVLIKKSFRSYGLYDHNDIYIYIWEICSKMENKYIL